MDFTDFSWKIKDIQDNRVYNGNTDVLEDVVVRAISVTRRNRGMHTAQRSRDRYR
jgi:hypothetical protein